MKPIFYYSVMTPNRGDMAIRKSITDAISERINIPFAFFNLKYEELTKDRILNQVNSEASCLMIAGSGLYSNYKTSSGWYFPCQTKLFKEIKVPIMLVGIGANTNLKSDIFKGHLTSKAKKSIKLINELSAISTVRDQRTKDLLLTLGIEKPKLMLDPANFLNVTKVPKEKRVAINLCQHAPSLGRFDGGNKGEIQRRKNIEFFSMICANLDAEGYKIVFISHDALEHSLYEDLKKLNPYIEYLNTDNIDEMLKEYAKCEFSIGMKMHANIMSFSAGTPFISLYYDKKSEEYLKLINHEAYSQPIFEQNYKKVTDKILSLISNLKFENEKFKQLKIVHKCEFDDLIDRICNIIKEK